MRQKKMRDKHGLRTTQVRVRRHERVSSRGRLINESPHHTHNGLLQLRIAPRKVQGHVERHLLVARSSGVKSTTGIANLLDQLALDKAVDILVRTVHIGGILQPLVENLAELREILDEGLKNAAYVNGPDEDVHSFVERKLIEKIGDAGRRLHTGRSRNEQVSLDMPLYLPRRNPKLQQAVVRVVRALVDQAAAAGNALMPSYTHLRRAQPVLVAHFFLAHAAALRRDHARLQTAIEEADSLTLGSGAVAGTSYPID